MCYNVIVRKEGAKKLLSGQEAIMEKVYRIGRKSRKGTKLSKELYTLKEATDRIKSVKFKCFLCDSIGAPVVL